MLSRRGAVADAAVSTVRGHQCRQNRKDQIHDLLTRLTLQTDFRVKLFMARVPSIFQLRKQNPMPRIS